MEQPIRSNITIKASSIHDCNNISEYSTIHEHTTTPPRIFRPLFQTKDSPSLGRRSSGLMSLIVIILLTILVSIASSNNTFATTSTLSLSVNDIVSLSLGSANNGVLVGSTSTTDTTISVNTTNATGYTLKIAASSGTSGTPAPLSNVDLGCSANCTIPSITTATSTNDASSLTTGTWGYLPSKLNSTTNTVYRPAPTVEGDILDITNAANASSNSSDNNNYNIAIGAKLDYATSTPGTYSSAFIVTAIANATPYTITYNANGGSNGPANENASTYASTVNISSTVPTKTNYTFLGWCAGTSSSSNITTSAGVDSCSATVYNPNGGGTNLGLAIDQTASSNDNYLYAMWSLNSYTVTVNFAGTGVSSVSFTNATYGNANTVSTSGGTTSLKHGVSYTITMSFSSSSYTINSWATTANGTLVSTTANPTTYTVTNTATLTATGKTNKIYFQDATFANCGSTMYDNRGVTAYKNVAYTTAKIGSLCWMTRNLDLPGGTTLTPSDSNVTSNYTLPASSTSGFSNESTAYVYNSDSTNFNDTSCGDENPCYSYYSWVAATAGTNPSSGAASSDICPKGWRLPTQAELTRLIFIYSYNTGAKLVAAPFLGVYAGYYLNSSFNYGGSYGRYWSSTANTASYAYRMYFNSSSANWDGNPKYYGFSVRCVKDNYMQNQTLSSLATLMPNEGDTVTLIDKRDEHEYSVAKIGSRYWMTRNLDLPGGTTIYKTDSNITADSYTLPASSTSGFSDDSTAYVYNSGRTTCSSNGTTGSCYSYYSYVAATAGTNPSSGAASSDICPKGWRLPTRAEFRTLIGTYTTGATLTASPFLGVYAGVYSDSSFYNGGSAGRYWSSTASGASNAYYLAFTSSSASVNVSYKSSGFSVRCVAKS